MKRDMIGATSLRTGDYRLGGRGQHEAIGAAAGICGSRERSWVGTGLVTSIVDRGFVGGL